MIRGERLPISFVLYNLWSSYELCIHLQETNYSTHHFDKFHHYFT
jgi:hypothetical protein